MKKFNRDSYKKKKPRRESSRSVRKDKKRSRRDSDRPNRRGPSRGSERPEMHRVTCDSCNKKCEVPFKPTSNKPVYCSDCFRKNEKSGFTNKDIICIKNLVGYHQN